MGAPKALRPIGFDEAKRIADAKGLVPVVVKGTERIPAASSAILMRPAEMFSGIVRFARQREDMSPKLEPIPWDFFEAICRHRGLGVFESGGWMRLKRVPG